MLNLLAFLFHTVLELCDEQYRRVRLELAVRRTFFNDLQALTRYRYFASWPTLINFMFTRLELDVADNSPPRRHTERRQDPGGLLQPASRRALKGSGGLGPGRGSG